MFTSSDFEFNYKLLINTPQDISKKNRKTIYTTIVELRSM